MAPASSVARWHLLMPNWYVSGKLNKNGLENVFHNILFSFKFWLVIKLSEKSGKHSVPKEYHVYREDAGHGIHFFFGTSAGGRRPEET